MTATAEVAVVEQQAPAALTAPRRTPVADKIVYARALAESGMLPRQYQKNPANLLYAVEYAEMLGCHPLTAVTGIHVIEGKPSASAALISALVRRAGHKLRVTGDAKSATAQIIRADDPEFTFTSTFTVEDARQAGLLGKNVWKQYPAAMLKARAITQVARDACEDALAGLHYTAEELGAETDDTGLPVNAASLPPADWSQQSTAPADDPWSLPLPGDVVTDVEWMERWMRDVTEATTKERLQELWPEMPAKHHARQLTDSDRADLTDLFKTIAAALPPDAPAPAADEPVDAELVEDGTL